ncbi:putative type II restriction endonuclease [Pseudomonas sp. R4-35-07]|uniref:HNH endonuclease n=1 Tax=Pseudomonas sp. R4-35-07 TaxID=658643 RepID=UPI000F58148A|nr:HNH endonuclease [Pseudomonas sp. R4-35-07]AZF32259.1 putative type II restriction endonuclease [Pseudomonas sp. R4-35-07]
MALFIQKPIFWNTGDYLAPSGVIGSSGFPEANGYGHEEWNNSPKMVLSRGNNRFRVFHTEGLGVAPIDENAGQTFVFLTASHDGIQQLVGIAGNAFGLLDEHHRAQREDIVRELSLSGLWEDAWRIENVRKQFEGNQRKFLKAWKKDLHWIPNWICPEDFFWWFDKPITLDPRTITGKKRMLGMYSRYTYLDLPTVGRIMDAIPGGQRNEKWNRLIDAIQCAPAEPLPPGEIDEGNEPITEVLTRVNARRGQGKFREDLMQVWGGACSVTALACKEILRASHVKPWVDSNAKQRLDRHNGLLLSANLDALFDKGLITFDSLGQMQISKRLDDKHRQTLGLPKPLRFVPKELVPYLEYHEKEVFQDSRSGITL